MREIYLTAELCRDRQSLHRHLAEQLSAPAWYGNNLDALHDLITQSREEVTFLIPDVEGLEGQLGGYARRLMRLLIDVSGENPNIHLIAK